VLERVVLEEVGGGSKPPVLQVADLVYYLHSVYQFTLNIFKHCSNHQDYSIICRIYSSFSLLATLSLSRLAYSAYSLLYTYYRPS